MPQLITVQLTPAEATLFKKFRQYQDDFQLLLEGEIFSFKNGCGKVFRNKDGVITNVRVESETFRKKKKI